MLNRLTWYFIIETEQNKVISQQYFYGFHMVHITFFLLQDILLSFFLTGSCSLDSVFESDQTPACFRITIFNLKNFLI